MKHNNASNDYVCPICLAISGIENEDTWIVQDDIFYRDNLVVGFISSKAIKGNDGHPLIVPVNHHENLYELPDEVAHRVMEVSKKTAIALKEIRKADGVSVMQFNEPAGGQHAFHYHMHVIPRLKNDQFETEIWKAKRSDPKDRIKHANQLKKYFSVNK